MNELFEMILEKDEKIVRVAKPVKAKLMTSCMAWVLAMWAICYGCGGWVVFLPLTDGGMPLDWWIGVIITVGSLILPLVISIPFFLAYHKNRYYAYTNKRVIIRTGVFGIDYKGLDLKAIDALNVYVSFFDKLVKKDTGSLKFGSKASPIINYGNGSGGYKFTHVEKPYEFYREVKEYIDVAKAGEQGLSTR
ncbi:MAG: hypothetical protein FWE84_02335 [Firmicutes bacterium]|nr:hypothetical protein [Bacillota bacterium]